MVSNKWFVIADTLAHPFQEPQLMGILLYISIKYALVVNIIKAYMP